MKIPQFIIILAILIFPTIAQDFSITPPSKSLDITFNSPNGERGWSNPYVETFEILITNEMNLTLPVSVSSSSDDLQYVSVSSSKSFLSIPPLGSESVTITVKVVDSAADGGRYSGRVRFTSDFQTEFVDVNIETHWPPPTLILQGDLNFGELKSGNSYSRSFTLKEIYKFRRANNVNIKFVDEGPIYSATVSPSTFSYIDSSGRSITFSFKVKDRNIVPDTYSMPISVSSTNDAQLISKLKYSIPKPVVEVGQPQNELIFDYGKPDNGNQKIVISERGGMTPLENTVISFKKMDRELESTKKEYGQTTWFSFPKQMDYIPPGGSKTIDINVIKPEDAPIGKYTWVGEVQTKYAGNEPFQFSFSVRPPDIDELKKKLTDLKSTQFYKNYPQAENLLSTTESLLLKDETRLADITNVISLTNIVITFFTSLNDAYEYLQQGNSGSIEAYEKFMESNEEISELNSITLKQTYDSENTDIKTSAASVWEEVANKLVIRLEQRADRYNNSSNSDASYVEAKRTHEKIGEICSLLNDSMCMQDQNSKVAGINKKIEQLILENAFLESETKRVQEEINANTWTFLSIKLIKNPLGFPALLDRFNEIINNYNHIVRNYQLIEDQIGMVKTEENLAAMKKEYWNFRLANSIYIIFLGIVIIVTAWKSVRGFLYYQADANDMRLAEVAQLKRVN